MRVMLLNDTGTVPHAGCQAVSDAHARMLGALGHRVTDRAFLRELRHFAAADERTGIDAVLADEGFRARLDAVDAVVVNGEGTLHHGFGTEYYAVLGAAQRLKKATLIVNSVFEANAGWQQTLNRLDDFCVRDAMSRAAAEAAGVRCRLVPDSVLAAKFDAPACIDLTGQILVTDWHPARDRDVGVAMRRILDSVDGVFYYPLMHGLQAHLWRSAVATLATADVVITGRHHGLYLAAAARKPFVALPSNTHKIEGLMHSAGVGIPVCTRAEQVIAAMQWAQDHWEQYERLFAYLEQAVPLTTFDALGRGSDDTDAEREVARLAEQLRPHAVGTDPGFWPLAPEPVEARKY